MFIWVRRVRSGALWESSGSLLRALVVIPERTRMNPTTPIARPNEPNDKQHPERAQMKPTNPNEPDEPQAAPE